MESGIRALTLALALRLPGDYLPLEGPGVTDQQESVAGLSGHSLLTAFPLKCGSLRRRPMERGGGSESVADLLRHSLTAKGGNEGCWSGCLGGGPAGDQTDRRASTASLIDLGIGTAAGTGYHRPGSAIGTKKNPTCSVPFRNRWNKWNKEKARWFNDFDESPNPNVLDGSGKNQYSMYSFSSLILPKTIATMMKAIRPTMTEPIIAIVLAGIAMAQVKPISMHRA